MVGWQQDLRNSLSLITLIPLPSDLIPLLELIWKGTQVMINTIHSVNKRKRKQADMITRSSTTTLSPSFTRQTFPKS